MLPLFNVQISDIAEVGFNPHIGSKYPIGSAFWFSWDAVLTTAEKEGTNFDIFLTRKLAKFLNDKKTKTTLLVFYTSVDDRFALTICSRKSPDFLNVLHSTAGMPGYLECGQDYVSSTAKPFLYYAGLQIFRVYQVEKPQEDVFYVSDFGDLFGLITSVADEESYTDIRDNPTEYLDYCAVPTDPTTRLTVGNDNIIIHHAFINLK